jgi:hypothetical protein
VRAESRIAYGHLQPIRATATRDDLIADANAMHGNEGAKTMGSDPNFGGQQGTEEWLTVKEFAALVRMKEHSVREAIRKNRLMFGSGLVWISSRGALARALSGSQAGACS